MSEAVVKKCVAVITYMAYDLFFDQSDDEFETQAVNVRTRRLMKVEDYSERIVPSMDDKTFQRHFRLTRITFSLLLDRLAPTIIHHSESGRPENHPEKKLMVAIWILGNQESFRSVADRFNVSTSTAHAYVMEVVDALLQLNAVNRIISWPDEARSITIQQYFLNSYHFPGVVGAIDGCHVNIKAPSVMPASYINRKGVHSILLQGVCDHQLQFIDCYAGEVGSIHDACLFRRSDLSERMERIPEMFMNNSHLIGDQAYPLKQHLLVAFKNNGHLTRKEEKYSRTLSAARSCIERTFALLKGRWRRMKYLDMSNIRRIPFVIIACCILHNVCIQNKDLIDIETTELDDVDDMGITYASTHDADRREGSRKRTDIMNNL